MRQFVYENEEDENSESSIKKLNEEVFDSKIIYRKQKPIKVMNSLPKVRRANDKLKKTSISYIIKYVQKFRFSSIYHKKVSSVEKYIYETL